ncbi:MAG: CDP-diacylglycerol--glycerol-3-phosphate 3-phosphatidyltransferase [Nitrospirales bacterium]
MSQVDTIKGKSLNQMPKNAASNFNLPNSITFLRIILIPVFIWMFSDPTPERAWWSVIIFSCAALTDFLDGYFARKSGQITNLGKLLDPVADKLLVASGLILLVQFQRVSVWLAIVLIARELIVTGARAVAAREGLVVPADTMGKVKVVAQISGILCLIAMGIWKSVDPWLLQAGNILLYVALAFSLWSCWGYLACITKKIGPQW